MKIENREELLSDIVRASGLHKSRIFNIYLFGSRVYNTYNKDSDWDVIIVANNSVESIEIRNGLYNIHIYTPDKFKADLDWHRPNNLECIFAPEWAILKEDKEFTFKLNLSKLRHAISHTSSNSWVKADKKIQFDEYHTGIKSLFHSIRIPMFATQIAMKGRIYDFECANFIWDKIMFKDLPNYMRNKKWTWIELETEFKQLRNKINSDFRKYSPCEKNYIKNEKKC